MRKFLNRGSVCGWVVLLLLLVSSGFAQGIHTTLRSQKNDYPAYQSYAGIWGDGHYAYLASERRNGVLIYDISNPDAPVLASYYNPTTPNSLDMEDVKVANGVGFFADNMGSGLHIVDVSDPTNPRLLSQITSANGGYDNTHKVSIWGNFVFIAQNLKAPALIQVFDVTDPASPVYRMTMTATDPQWINDIDIQQTTSGSVRLYTAGWGGKCDIWDITNIATQAPVLLGSFSAGIDGSSASATADGNYLAYSRKTTDGTSEVKIYNITNPASATVASTITMSGLGIDAVAPHDPKIMGNLMYVSWFQAGTLIFDISDPTHPVLVGSYDTWPGAVNSGQLDGNWGVYPYLGQDRVLLSDRNTGLYIIDATGVNSSPALYNFKVNPTSVVGPMPSTATVYLVGLADGGSTINLSSNSSLAIIPPTVTVPVGATSANVSVSTSGVATKSTATLTANYNTASVNATLTITPEIPSTLKFSPSSFVGGGSTTGTVTLAAPAPQDTSVALAIVSGGTAIASLPSSVTVLAGSSSANFTVATNPVSVSTTPKISATLNGTTVNGTFTVTANIPSSLSFSPSSVTAGQSSTGTVSFAAAVPSDTTVTLAVTAGSSAVGSIPASVKVLAGTTSATFTVSTVNVLAKTTVTVSATANGGTKTANLTVNANTPSSVSFVPSSVVSGQSSTGTVKLLSAAAGDITVTLTVTAGSSAVTSIPPSVVVPNGATSATFTVVTANVSAKTTVTVSGTANGASKTGNLTVSPITPSSLSFSPSTTVAGQSSTGTVTLNAAALGPLTVNLAVTAGSNSVLSIPASVTVATGAKTATFSVVTTDVSTKTTVTVSATANGTSKSSNLAVTANTPTGVTFTPSSVTGGGSSTGKVSFGKPLATTISVSLSIVSGASAISSMPSSVTVPAGSSSATWTVVTQTVSATTTVQISATANGGSKIGTLTVK
jgi:hypothetical protein